MQQQHNNHKDNAETQPARPAAEEIEQRYLLREYNAHTQAEKEVLESSFAALTKQREKLGDTYELFQQYYTDLMQLYAENTLPLARRQRLKMRIYDQYFELLGALPYRVRGKVHGHAYIRKMHRLVKSGRAHSSSLSFWLDFTLRAGPPLALGVTGEVLLLNHIDTGPLWAVIVSAVLFAAGFGFYFWVAASLEGKRLYSGLQKWLSYRISPDEYQRPSDWMQYVKMCVPLLVAVGSALIKFLF